MPDSQKKKLYDFLQAAIAAAVAPAPLAGAELRFTHFEFTDEAEYGICLGNVVSDPRPARNGTGCEEFDARLIVTTYCRLTGIERDERTTAYEKSKALALAVAALLWQDEGLGGRTCNTWPGRLIDDFDELSAGQTHAVNNLYVAMNRTGKELPELWS